MKVRDYILRIAGVVLCIGFAAILITLFFMNHRRNKERASEIEQRTQAIKEEESLKLEKASDIYDDLAEDPGLRSIVCWGDNEMAGSGDANLPRALKEVAEENLFGGVREAFSGLIDLEGRTSPSVTVTNMGVSDEGMREILVRAGVRDMTLGEWTLFPGDAEPKNLTLTDGNAFTPLHFAEQREARFGKAVIAGVEGTLTAGDGEYDEDHPRFAFVRDEEGESFQAGAGTQVEIESAERFIGDVPVFFFEDDSADSVDGFVSDIEELVWRYTENAVSGEEESAETASTGSTAEFAAEEEPSDGIPYVVICTAEEDSDLDAALSEAFGSNYLRNDTYAYEMSEESYRNLAQRVYDNLDSQGCFNTAKKKAAKAAEDFDSLSVKIEH